MASDAVVLDRRENAASTLPVVVMALPPVDVPQPAPTEVTVPLLTVEITPPEAVIVVLSTFARPKRDALVFWIAGAASDRIKVVATPLTAVSLPVAVGLAPRRSGTTAGRARTGNHAGIANLHTLGAGARQEAERHQAVLIVGDDIVGAVPPSGALRPTRGAAEQRQNARTRGGR